jgi:pyridoxal phosphate enzyme (YggS family)
MTNFQNIKNTLSERNITLVAVSKTKPNEAIQGFYNQGQRIFGENKVQELVGKHEALPKDIQWHLIGHLQTNKVKYAASFVDTIHSVESLKLLKEINKQAKKSDRIINCLLQMKIAEEETKFGMSLEDIKALLASEAYANFEHINITGVMGMATFTDNQDQVRAEFKRLKSIFDLLKNDFFADKIDFKTISMGMSGDYELAIEEGSTMVRIGSLLFGSR